MQLTHTHTQVCNSEFTGLAIYCEAFHVWLGWGLSVQESARSRVCLLAFQQLLLNMKEHLNHNVEFIMCSFIQLTNRKWFSCLWTWAQTNHALASETQNIRARFNKHQHDRFAASKEKPMEATSIPLPASFTCKDGASANINKHETQTWNGTTCLGRLRDCGQVVRFCHQPI